MLILTEKQRVNEMSRLVVSDIQKDGLPFRVVINSVEPARDSTPHGHLLDLQTGKIEIGTFKLPNNLPNSPNDIEGYVSGKHKGINDEQREYLFPWFSKQNKRAKAVGGNLNNLQMLWLEWSGAVIK
jgi:hypothetical protein